MNIRPDETEASYIWGKSRNHEDRDPAVPSSNAEALFLITERGMEVTQNSESIYKIIEREPEAPPSEHARLEINMQELSGAVELPGKYSKALLDTCIYVAGLAALVMGPKYTLQATGEFPWPVAIGIVAVQIIGVGGLVREVLRRRR